MPNHQISWKSTQNFLYYPANRQTDKTHVKTWLPPSCGQVTTYHNQAYSEYKHSLTFRVRHYVIVATKSMHWLRYVVIASKPVHRLQICPIVHNYRAPLLFCKLNPGPCSSVGMWRGTDSHDHYSFRIVYNLRNVINSFTAPHSMMTEIRHYQSQWRNQPFTCQSSGGQFTFYEPFSFNTNHSIFPTHTQTLKMLNYYCPYYLWPAYTFNTFHFTGHVSFYPIIPILSYSGNDSAPLSEVHLLQPAFGVLSQLHM